jgi:hypothetical protein
LLELERNNLLRALEACQWRVSGDQGAARLLTMPPTTLASRMKALGIERPRRNEPWLTRHDRGGESDPTFASFRERFDEIS